MTRFGYPLLALLALLLYGRHLGGGPLADDFLYLSWLDQGLGELLRRVTVDSDPRMIRPLPALAWCLDRLPAGAVLQHALSILLHAVAGWLVARLAARTSGSRELGLLLGAIFVSFPLFTEPVIWLSAGPDLWATVLALAALDVGLRGDLDPKRLALVAMLFLLSLLSKESTFFLPLVVLCLVPWSHARRLSLVLGAVAVVYLAFRLLLLHGPGGYLDASGRPRALDLEPLRFVRNLVLQLPYRVVMPLKRAGDLALPVALVSTALAASLVFYGKLWRRPRALGLAAVATVLALLPAAPFFSVGYDHENSRMLYFPIAVLTVALGGVFPRPTKATRWTLIAVVCCWSLATFANGRSWSQGAGEVRRTLAAMQAVESRVPAGATVLVAGHDTWRGAYVWRNGLAFAARRHGLRDDVSWALGSGSLIGNPAVLGQRVFEIGLGAPGGSSDWTACHRALVTQSPTVLARHEVVQRSKEPGAYETGSIRLPRSASSLAVRIVAPADRGDESIEGRLFWRPRGLSLFDLPGFDVPSFNLTESRRFRILPRGQAQAVVRLPASPEPIPEIELRLELSPSSRADQLEAIEVVAAPDICFSP